MEGATSLFDTPVGPLLARVAQGHLVALSFFDPGREARPFDGPPHTDDAGLLHAVEAQIGEYFARKRTDFDLPVLMQGPAFHRSVWTALRDIPYGRTVSYGQLAIQLGVPDSARAVGAANGANPVAIIVPCHRVIGADGSLVGYGGGLGRKRMLLDLESDSVRLAL